MTPQPSCGGPDVVVQVAAFAPGRVNLMGDHTDYAGGLALPVAIDLGTTVRGVRTSDRVELRSRRRAGPGPAGPPGRRAERRRTALGPLRRRRRRGGTPSARSGRHRDEHPPDRCRALVERRARSGPGAGAGLRRAPAGAGSPGPARRAAFVGCAVRAHGPAHLGLRRRRACAAHRLHHRDLRPGGAPGGPRHRRGPLASGSRPDGLGLRRAQGIDRDGHRPSSDRSAR